MDSSTASLNFLVGSATAGIVSAFIVLVVLTVIGRVGVTKSDMIVAMGSIFSPVKSQALLVGIIVNLLRGVVFGVFYALLLDVTGKTTILPLTLAGMFIGFLHGFVVALILVSVVAEHHPVEKFRKVGFDVACAYALAHIVFGGAMGWLVAFFGIYLPEVAQSMTALILG